MGDWTRLAREGSLVSVRVPGLKEGLNEVKVAAKSYLPGVSSFTFMVDVPAEGMGPSQESPPVADPSRLGSVPEVGLKTD